MTMYLEHFGLREAPFRITPHTEFFFSGANRGATLEALLYAITAGEGMVKVTGEVGSGKTMLCRVLMERLPNTVETIYLAVPSLSRDEMLAAIAGDLGIDTTGANTNKLVRALQHRLIEIHAAGRQVVALIDEAHAMPLSTLEEVRLLSNLETNKQKLLQIVLFGQPELDSHLSLAHMRQLKERITHSFSLAPLPPRDIRDYIAFRLRAAGYHGPDLFGTEALAIIADASEGLTRRINIYADKTLLAAFAQGTHTITADHVRAAVSDTQIVVTNQAERRPMLMAAAAGLVTGIAIGFGAAQLVKPARSLEAVVAAPRAPVPAPIASVPVATPATAPIATPATAPVADPPVAAAVAPPPSTPDPGPAAAAATPVAAGARLPVPDPVLDGLEAGRALLASPERRYGVQLMTTDPRERAYLEWYLAEASRAVGPKALFLFPAGTVESPRVGVVYGAFPARAQANEALNALPTTLRQFRPYVRTFESFRDDARQAERR